MDTDEDTLATFIGITDADSETAKSFLRLADGSLDLAVSMFLEHGASFVAPRSSAPSSTNNSASTNNNTNNNSNTNTDTVRAAIAPKVDTLVGNGYSDNLHFYQGGDDDDPMLDDPVALASSFSNRQFAGGVRGRAFNAASSSSAARGAFNDPLSVDPTDAKATKLAKMFATPYEIMFDGDWESAREYGQATSKWILVTVSDRTEFQCEAQKRDLWNNALVREMISAHFVFLF
ncbi:hypothetical protein HDU99_002946, partial [Rhizoclosmatium hyalinum]